MLHVAYATCGVVVVHRVVVFGLRCHLPAVTSGRGAEVCLAGLVAERGRGEVVFVESRGQRRRVDTSDRGVDKTRVGEDTEDAHDAARTVYVLHVV